MLRTAIALAAAALMLLAAAPRSAFAASAPSEEVIFCSTSDYSNFMNVTIYQFTQACGSFKATIYNDTRITSNPLCRTCVEECEEDAVGCVSCPSQCITNIDAVVEAAFEASVSPCDALDTTVTVLADAKPGAATVSTTCKDALRDTMSKRCYHEWIKVSPKVEHDLHIALQEHCLSVQWGWVFIVIGTSIVGAWILLLVLGLVTASLCKARPSARPKTL